MKKFIISTIIVILILPAIALADDKIEIVYTDLKYIDSFYSYVIYSWIATVYNYWDSPKSVFVQVKLFGDDGHLLDITSEVVDLQPGQNDLSGQGMIKQHLAEEVSQYKVTIE